MTRAQPHHSSSIAYSLVHIIAPGEFDKPLVASQVYDRAQLQASWSDVGAPPTVAVWAVEPMRRLFDRPTRETVRRLRQRSPGVDVRLIGGIGRLRSWPAASTLTGLRRRIGTQRPVVYHCRGESAFPFAAELRRQFPRDRIVLDVRGAWPLELLHQRGIYHPENATGQNKVHYEGAVANLRHAIKAADAVTTVSEPLRSWLVEMFDASVGTSIIPNCVTGVVDDDERDTVRRGWGVTVEPVLVYSGTTALYQHLQDVVFPFVGAIHDADSRARCVLLTPEPEAMRRISASARHDTDRTIIESCVQEDVASKLTGADAGLMLRRPSDVTRFSQPVKIAEYLASGAPLIVEEGIGTGLRPNRLEQAGAGITVHTVNQPLGQIAAEAARSLEWLRNQGHAARVAARTLAADEFTWSGARSAMQDLYRRALTNGHQHTPGK